MKLTRVNLGLALLVLALGAVEVWRGGARMVEREVGRLFPSFFADQAARVRLEGPAGEMELLRGADGWVCPAHFDHPARASETARLLRALTSLTTLDLLTRDPARHADYGLAEGGARVRVWDEENEVVVDLLQGDDVPGGGASYLRRFGDDAVYRAPVLQRIPTDPAYWLEPAWMPFEPALVTAIRIQGADFDPPRLLLREERRVRWSRDGQPLAATRVQALLNALQSLFLDGVVAGPDDPGALGEVVLRVELTLLGGDVLAGEFAAPSDGVVRARRDPRGWVVSLPAGSVDLVVQRAGQL